MIPNLGHCLQCEVHKKSTTLAVADWQWANGRNQSGMAAPRVREYRTRIPIPHPNDFAATFCIYTGTRTRRQDECRVVGWRLRGVYTGRDKRDGQLPLLDATPSTVLCSTIPTVPWRPGIVWARRCTAASKPCFSVPSWVLAQLSSLDHSDLIYRCGQASEYHVYQVFLILLNMDR